MRRLAAATCTVVIAPAAVSCGGSRPEATAPTQEPAPEPEQETARGDQAVPLTRPGGWDPISFNRDRGNSGAIPDSYLGDINGPDGELKHLGKHLPYTVEADPALVPEGYIAIMWGDASKGYARHPNSPKGDESYPRGHWYDWVRLRKAVDGEAEEAKSVFSGWPVAGENDSGKFAVQGGGDIEAESGKNTIYLVALPPDVQPGDTIRVHAHCLYHGEYVDFLDLR